LAGQTGAGLREPEACANGCTYGTNMEIEEYLDAEGQSPFSAWFEALDATAAARVTVALARAAQGNLSNAKGVGAGVSELRIDFGPGYRSYFGRDGATLIISRSHAAKELVKVEQLGEHVSGTIVAGSSVKFCRIAEGVADLYPRLGPTMEWDTAAGQAILEAAGGSVRTFDGETLAYGKTGFRNPHFIARGVQGGGRRG